MDQEETNEGLLAWEITYAAHSPSLGVEATSRSLSQPFLCSACLQSGPALFQSSWKHRACCLPRPSQLLFSHQ